jgi:Skp family chaperone for outer membrane proteins
MAKSPRAALAVGLSLLGAAGLVGRSLAQQPADSKVRQASTGQAAAPAAVKPVAPAVIGTVDIMEALKKYEKYKADNEAFKADVMAKQNELTKIANDGKQATEMLGRLQPGSPDYKKMESKVTELKAKYQAAMEQAQMEFAQRESEMAAKLYKDVQEMVSRVARARKMTYVVRINRDQINGSDPDTVQSAMSRTVVYSDPEADITDHVIYYLNEQFHRTNGVGSKPAAGQPAAASAGQPTRGGAAAPGGGN